MPSNNESSYTSYTSASEDIGSEDSSEVIEGVELSSSSTATTTSSPASSPRRSPRLAEKRSRILEVRTSDANRRGEVPPEEEPLRHRPASLHDHCACVEPAAPEGRWTASPGWTVHPPTTTCAHGPHPRVAKPTTHTSRGLVLFRTLHLLKLLKNRTKWEVMHAFYEFVIVFMRMGKRSSSEVESSSDSEAKRPRRIPPRGLQPPPRPLPPQRAPPRQYPPPPLPSPTRNRFGPWRRVKPFALFKNEPLFGPAWQPRYFDACPESLAFATSGVKIPRATARRKATRRSTSPPPPPSPLLPEYSPDSSRSGESYSGRYSPSLPSSRGSSPASPTPSPSAGRTTRSGRFYHMPSLPLM
ncbi:hypothetical protein CDAR_49482, partial [Caerostris darwini]